MIVAMPGHVIVIGAQLGSNKLTLLPGSDYMCRKN